VAFQGQCGNKGVVRRFLFPPLGRHHLTLENEAIPSVRAGLSKEMVEGAVFLVLCRLIFFRLGGGRVASAQDFRTVTLKECPRLMFPCFGKVEAAGWASSSAEIRRLRISFPAPMRRQKQGKAHASRALWPLFWRSGINAPQSAFLESIGIVESIILPLPFF